MKTFFYSDDEKAQQMTFMEAITYIEASPVEKGVSVSQDYYRHFESNDKAFDDMLSAEGTVTTEKVMVTGNDAKVIKLLKAIKADPRLTDDQEEKLNVLITRWEAGEIPAKVSKDVVKRSKVVTDVLEFYFEIIKLVPDTYFEEQKKQINQQNEDKQVILSCYMKAYKK